MCSTSNNMLNSEDNCLRQHSSISIRPLSFIEQLGISKSNATKNIQSEPTYMKFQLIAITDEDSLNMLNRLIRDYYISGRYKISKTFGSCYANRIL